MNRKPVAKSVLRSWTRSVGSTLPVHALLDTDPLELGYNFSAEVAGSPSKEVAQEALSVIEEKLGKRIVSRGPVAPKTAPKGLSASEMTLAAMRHRDFHLAPNPPRAVWNKYMPIMVGAVNSYYRKWRGVFSMAGFEAEDLHSYGMVWLCIFAHKYETETEEKDRAIFRSYITQRLLQVRCTLDLRMKNYCPDWDTAVDSLMESDVQVQRTEPGEPPDLYYDRNEEGAQPANSIKGMSRSVARAKLAIQLTNLPHSELVTALNKQLENPSNDAQTKNLCRKILHRHQNGCEVCQQ